MSVPRPRVLIVDDSDHTLDVLLRSLRRHGYADLTTAVSVPEAIDLLGAGLPEAILLDLSLSLQDGHRLLRHVRGAPHWSSIPVFLLTGHHPAAAIQAAAQEGASGFITQPFNGTEIDSKIHHAVRGQESRAAELDDLLRGDPAPSASREGHPSAT